MINNIANVVSFNEYINLVKSGNQAMYYYTRTSWKYNPKNKNEIIFDPPFSTFKIICHCKNL